MKYLLVLVAVCLSACGANSLSNNIILTQTGGVAVASLQIDPTTYMPKTTFAGSANGMLASAPMVRMDKAGNPQMVKVRGVCGEENSPDSMVISDGNATANVSAANGIGQAVALSQGVYVGEVARYYGLANLAKSMGSATQGGNPAFTYDCSKVAPGVSGLVTAQ